MAAWYVEVSSESDDVGAQKSMPSDLSFDEIKEHRSGYFVEYHPPYVATPFAILQLIFHETTTPRNAANLMEHEARHWLARYPVPIMVSAFDDTGDLIRLNNVRSQNHLIGFRRDGAGEAELHWELKQLDDFIEKNPMQTDLRKIYVGLKYRTQADIQKDVLASTTRLKAQSRALRIFLTFWYAVIPAVKGTAISLLGIGTVITVVKAFRTTGKFWGQQKLSVSQSAKAEKERRMRHYYYHCERNPIGFLKLRSENIEADERARIQREAASLRQHKEEGITPPP